jgi:hypothetical protein
MKRSLKVVGILLGIISLVCITSAIAVGNIAINPSGDLVSGVTSASASFIVNFPSSGGYTFDNGNTLAMDTQLDDASWTYSVILDGIENPPKTENGPNIRISGWELSYPSDRTISLKVKMQGTAPTVDKSEEKILVRVRELSGGNVAVTGSEVVKTKMVLNPASIGETISAESANLTALRTKIDELAGRGVDVSAVESKYGQASTLLQTAKQSSDVARASTALSQATKIIDEIESAVVVMEAQNALSRAESSIGQTDKLITYFKVNKSMSSDARLMPIITKWEIAAEKLSTAKDLYSQGKYDDAATKADEAAAKGDEVLTEAQALKEKVDSSPFAALGGIGSAIAGSIFKIIIIIVVVVLVVVGILLFRRRRRWDELG